MIGHMDKDLYGILGVSRDIGEDELRKTYRKLAREHHPDVNPNDSKAEERFKEISFAYEVLSDKDKRRRYDEFGMQGLSEGFDANQARAYERWSRGAHRSPQWERDSSGVNLEDLLSGMFGGRASAPIRGQDAEGEITIDFLDAVRGGEVRVQFAGKGALRVRVPAGSDSGTKVRLKGQGEPGPGGASGDLYLTLRVRPHPFFTRDGADLSLDVPVTLPELILGASIDVPTPDGPAKMTIPKASSNGQRLRLRGKGAVRRGSDGRGDLYVRLVAKLPDSQDEAMEKLAKEMEPLYGDDDVRQRLKVGR